MKLTGSLLVMVRFTSNDPIFGNQERQFKVIFSPFRRFVSPLVVGKIFGWRLVSVDAWQHSSFDGVHSRTIGYSFNTTVTQTEKQDVSETDILSKKMKIHNKPNRYLIFDNGRTRSPEVMWVDVIPLADFAEANGGVIDAF